MEEDVTSYFFDFPFQNGFLTFTLGILFTLTVYHFVLFFQQKEKLYLLYSGYTFFILISQLNHLENGFIYQLFLPIHEVTTYPTVATEIYYILYVLFAFKFLDFKSHLPKWHKWSKRALYLIVAFCLLAFIAYLIYGDRNILSRAYFYFTIPMTLFGLIMYIPFIKVKGYLKYYIIIGSLILMSTSLASLLYYLKLEQMGQSTEPAFSILYIGFILENILFSLGLGHKQKLILFERDQSQSMLIKQLKENKKLTEQIQFQLEKDIEIVSKKAEQEKIENLKTKYEKELAELKLSSLRSQMNPHFIFNSLNSIKRYIIDSEKENAVFYLNKFSKLIRKILTSTASREIALSEELETIKLYVKIENIRFNNTIDFIVDVDKSLNLTAIKIPSLITQPFIENAIWHGLSLKENDRILILKISRENHLQLKIEIIDNGIGRVKSGQIKEKKLHKRTSFGIKLSKERLMHFSSDFKGNYKLTFSDLYNDDTPAGTKVTLLIPTK